MLSLLPVGLFLGTVADGGTDPFALLNQPTVPHEVPAPVDFTDLGAVAQNVWEAIINRQWGLVASLGVVLIILAARRFVPAETAVGAWIASKLGAVISNFVLSFGAAFATMFAAGQSFTSVMLFKALSVALSAAGGWAIWKNVNEAIQEKKAQTAGEAVAADPKKVEDTLNK